MKTFTLKRHHPAWLLLLCLLPAAACTSTGTIRGPAVKSSYDSVEGVTVWEHTPLSVGRFNLTTPTILMQVGAICEGDWREEPCDDPRFILAFKVDTEAISTPNLTLRLGQRRLRPTPLVDEIGTGIAGSRHLVAFDITREDAIDLALLPDGEVEGRLLNVDLNLSFERREAIRMLLQRFGIGDT